MSRLTLRGRCHWTIPIDVRTHVEPQGLDLSNWPSNHFVIDAREITTKLTRSPKGNRIGTNGVTLEDLLGRSNWFVTKSLIELQAFLAYELVGTKEPPLIVCVFD